nr:hypothetical protein [Rathayibacter tritici]
MTVLRHSPLARGPRGAELCIDRVVRACAYRASAAVHPAVAERCARRNVMKPHDLLQDDDVERVSNLTAEVT